MTPAFTSPYAPAIVDLDEGFQLLTNIVGCDAADVCVGLRVQVRFHTLGERTLPCFEPAGP